MKLLFGLIVAFLAIPMSQAHADSPAPTRPAAAVGQAASVGTSQQIVLASGGSYWLHIPPGTPPEGGWEWALAYHGKAWTGKAHESQTGLSALADRPGHERVLIYPDGRDGVWNAGYCCGGSRDDVAFSRLVVGDASTRVPLRASGDATGGSNGAMMAGRMACQAPDIIRKAVMVAGALTVDCRGTRIRMLRLHSPTDNVVPLCPKATTTGGCKGGGPVANVIFWDQWKTQLMIQRGSEFTTELFTGGHTWTQAQSQRTLAYLETT